MFRYPSRSSVSFAEAAKLGNRLDRVNFTSELGENRGLITRPCADLQTLSEPSDFEKLGHGGNDVWLRDRRAVTDVQRPVIVSLAPQVARNELRSRYGPNCTQHLAGLECLVRSICSEVSISKVRRHTLRLRCLLVVYWIGEMFVESEIFFAQQLGSV